MNSRSVQWYTYTWKANRSRTHRLLYQRYDRIPQGGFRVQRSTASASLAPSRLRLSQLSYKVSNRLPSARRGGVWLIIGRRDIYFSSMIPPRVVPMGDWVHDEDLDPSARARGGELTFFFIGACLYVCVCAVIVA